MIKNLKHKRHHNKNSKKNNNRINNNHNQNKNKKNNNCKCKFISDNLRFNNCTDNLILNKNLNFKLN